MSTALTILTLAHVVISLVGIFSGLFVVYGLLTLQRLNGWTAVSLTTTIATSVTGFFFPIHHLTPGLVLGIVSLVVLRWRFLPGTAVISSRSWRWIYVISAMIALYLNVFVLIVQSFLKVPALSAIAPTQSEPPFQVTQIVVLVVFIALTAAAVIRFRNDQPIHDPKAAHAA